MPITDHPYRDDADRDAILRFLSAANAADTPRLRYWHVGDIVWAMYQNMVFDPRASFHLWQEDGELVGVGWFEAPHDFAFQILPRKLSDESLAEAMLAWAADHAREHGAGSSDALRVNVRSQFAEHRALLDRHGFVRDTSTPRGLIERRGYAPDGYYMIHFRRDLREPLPDSRLLPGWTVRPVGDEDEWPERVDLHRVVWAPSRVTLDAYRRLRAAPIYRPALDLVVVAPDGQLAAYCICWLDADMRVAEFEPVGTHPDFRGRGAGRLLLLEAFRRLRGAGAETAIVLTNANNNPAVRLYESAGFTIADTEYTYMRAP